MKLPSGYGKRKKDLIFEGHVMETYGQKRSSLIVKIFGIIFLPLLVYEWYLIYSGTYETVKRKSLIYILISIITVAFMGNVCFTLCIKEDPLSMSQILKELSGIMNLFMFSLSLALVFMSPFLSSKLILAFSVIQMCLMGCEIIKIQVDLIRKKKKKEGLPERKDENVGILSEEIEEKEKILKKGEIEGEEPPASYT